MGVGRSMSAVAVGKLPLGQVADRGTSAVAVGKLPLGQVADRRPPAAVG